MRNLILSLSLLPLFHGACAGPAANIPQNEPREDRHFEGNPFSVRYLNGLSRDVGPSNGLVGEAGRITGVMCGTDVEMTATYQSDHLAISGFVENQHPARFEIREVGATPGERGFLRITGSLAYRNVALELFGDRLVGWVGHCQYDLKLRNDPETREEVLMQLMRALGYTLHVRLAAVDALWKLPPAMQAVALPMVIMCMESKIFQNLGQEPPVMGFGGPVRAMPPGTISFVTKNTYCR